MPFHICFDEIYAFMMMFPFLAVFARKMHLWYKAKFTSHHCHEMHPAKNNEEINIYTQGE